MKMIAGALACALLKRSRAPARRPPAARRTPSPPPRRTTPRLARQRPREGAVCPSPVALRAASPAAGARRGPPALRVAQEVDDVAQRSRASAAPPTSAKVARGLGDDARGSLCMVKDALLPARRPPHHEHQCRHHRDQRDQQPRASTCPPPSPPGSHHLVERRRTSARAGPGRGRSSRASTWRRGWKRRRRLVNQSRDVSPRARAGGWSRCGRRGARRRR